MYAVKQVVQQHITRSYVASYMHSICKLVSHYMLKSYMHHVLAPSLLLLLIIFMQSNKSVKPQLTCDVQKIQYSELILMSNTIQYSALPCTVFATQPHPSLCIF